jgi:hypothetical protein
MAHPAFKIIQSGMKAGPSKFVEKTGTQEKTVENGATQAKSAGQNIHGTFQYKNGAYFLHMGEAKL